MKFDKKVTFSNLCVNYNDERESLSYFLNYSCHYTLFSKAKIWHDMPLIMSHVVKDFRRGRKFGESKIFKHFFSPSSFLVPAIPRVFYVICLSTCLISSIVLKWMNGKVEQNLKEAKFGVCDHHPKQVILLNYVSNQWYSFLLNWEKLR